MSFKVVSSTCSLASSSRRAGRFHVDTALLRVGMTPASASSCTRRTRTRFYTTTIQPSSSANRTENPIRKLVERTQVQPNPELEMIPLSIGDPTHFGNFGPPASLTKKMTDLLVEQKANGYGHSTGSLAARESIAKKFSGKNSKFPLTPDDVILASGCSHALDLAIQVLAEPGV